MELSISISHVYFNSALLSLFSFVLNLVVYNGSLSSKIVHNIGADHSELLNDLANYKPPIYTAKEISLFEHAIFYPPNANLLEISLQELEKLHIRKENASKIDSQIQIAETLLRANLISQDQSS